jgi:restriction system protein
MLTTKRGWTILFIGCFLVSLLYALAVITGPSNPSDQALAITLLIFLGGSLFILRGGLLLIYRLIRGAPRYGALRQKTLGELLVLTPSQFEVAMCSVLETMGYRKIVRTGRAGDLAADITCQDDKGTLVVVQCKRYAPGNSVGSPEMQSFIGMMSVHHGTHRGIFVTTSDFSAPARNLAQMHGIQLIDGQELSQLAAGITTKPTSAPDSTATV